MKKFLHAHTYTHLIRQNIQSNIKLFRGSDNPSTAGQRLGGQRLSNTYLAIIPMRRYHQHSQITTCYQYDNTS